MSFESFQNMMSAEPPLESRNSFTALLELPLNQAVKLLDSPEVENSSETASSILPNSSCNNSDPVKQEPVESGSMHNSSPICSDLVISRSTKQKDQEKKVCDFKTSAIVERQRWSIGEKP